MAQILDLIIGRGEFYNRFSADKRRRQNGVFRRRVAGFVHYYILARNQLVPADFVFVSLNLYFYPKLFQSVKMGRNRSLAQLAAAGKRQRKFFEFMDQNTYQQ